MSKNRVKKNYSQLSKYLNILQALGVFLVMFIAMSIIFPKFLTIINLTNLMKQLSVVMILGAGMTFCILSGEFDISIGSVVGLAGVTAGLLIPNYGIFLGILAAILVGISFGFFNGVVTTKGKIPSFITTLGTLLIARSLAYVITKGKVISDFPSSFKIIGQGTVFGIPLLFIIVIIIYGIAFTVLRKTAFGVSVYSVGSNRTVAMLSGINADRVKITAFMISGTLAGFCGVLMSSRAMAVQAMTGMGLEFEVIAAVVIGGASLRGGEGNILQTIIGVLIIGLIRNGLNMSHVDVYWNDFVKGFVIIFAVLLDSLRKVIQSKISEKAYLE